MEKLIVEEICSNLKWYEKIIVKIFAKLFIKIYHIGRLNCLNSKIKNNYTKWNMGDQMENLQLHLDIYLKGLECQIKNLKLY